MKAGQIITVYEHQVLKLGDLNNGVHFDLHTLNSLQLFHGIKGSPYYSLGYNCIKFNSYVGVLQVGKVMIEILPKADVNEDNSAWRNLLIGMLLVVQNTNTQAPSSSALSIKANSILDLYFQLFLTEIELLIRLGLIKKYKSEEKNQTVFKGSLLVSKNLQYNLVHKERFFTRHYRYDQNHLMHQLLWSALLLIKKHNTSQVLQNRVQQAMLYFPEQENIKVADSVFSRIKITRKTAPYETALSIAQMLLLNYYPDVKRGNRHVLALLFNMNDLWETFVCKTLNRYLNLPDVIVRNQQRKNFWKPQYGYNSYMKADIVISYKDDEELRCIVLDTKWKMLNGYNPSPEDLRQLYVYHEYYQANRAALVYPGTPGTTSGFYYDYNGCFSNKSCAVLLVGVSANISEWQKQIVAQIYKWVGHDINSVLQNKKLSNIDIK